MDAAGLGRGRRADLAPGAGGRSRQCIVAGERCAEFGTAEVLDAWLPWLKQLGSGLASYFPLLLNWAGYAVWLLWGLGMLALILLGALAHRYLSAAQR